MKRHFNLVPVVFLVCFIFFEVSQLKAQNSMGPHPIEPWTMVPSTAATPRHELSDSVQLAWVSHYASGLLPVADWSNTMVMDSAGNVYVTGCSRGSGTEYDYATVKYDASGVEQWVARYNGPENSVDEAWALAVDGAGNVYVTGYSTGSGTEYDYATVKYDASGAEQWVARYNGPGNGYDEAWALAVDGAGNVYVTGYSAGSGTVTDYATVKYDASGVEQWVARYNSPANSSDGAMALVVDGDGNVYVTGYSMGSGTAEDYATVKYDASGAEQWVARYNGPANSSDGAMALAVDGTGNVYVTGYSTGSDWSVYTTIKYIQTPTGVVEVPLGVPQHYRLLQNYPNPFNPLTTIRYDLPNAQFVTLKVYDILGREVATLVDNRQPAGSYSVHFDARQLASGIYFYRINAGPPDRRAGNFMQAKKMLIVR
jgi:hypothetical protein